MSNSLDQADQAYQDRHETIDIADLHDVEVENPSGDVGDLADAMLVSACFSDGTPLTNIELSDVDENNRDWVQEMAMEAMES
mgnify:CR=1 FL=1|tara:strand:+ start:683 stop:928 length:246 start_codon:yes stop_codon:yes gene_type:complete